MQRHTCQHSTSSPWPNVPSLPAAYARTRVHILNRADMNTHARPHDSQMSNLSLSRFTCGSSPPQSPYPFSLTSSLYLPHRVYDFSFSAFSPPNSTALYQQGCGCASVLRSGK